MQWLSWALGGKKIALRGGGGTRKPIFPTPPPSLAAVMGGGGSGQGAPDLPCRGDQWSVLID